MYYRWNGGKGSIDSIWPIDDKVKEDKKLTMTAEDYQNILKRHRK